MTVKFKPNSAGIRDFLKSKQVQEMLAAEAEKVRSRAGDGFTAQVNVGTRARATVLAETPQAKRRQARDHILERAVGGG